MSVENHPNLHAAGLVADIYLAVDNRIRGAALQHKERILTDSRLSKMTMDFVNKLDEELDRLVELLQD